VGFTERHPSGNSGNKADVCSYMSKPRFKLGNSQMTNHINKHSAVVMSLHQ